MPAKSKKQRKFMGIARAIQKGTFEGTPSAEVKKAARTMSVADVKEFAKTKEKGLPVKKRKKITKALRS